METMNGRMRPSTATSQEIRALENILNTKGVTVAYEHPTPRDPDVGWGCADHATPEIFDPDDDDMLAEALSVCGGCAARLLCLDLGLRRAEWGVWGGVLLEDGKPIEKVKRRGRPRKVAA